MQKRAATTATATTSHTDGRKLESIDRFLGDTHSHTRPPNKQVPSDLSAAIAGRQARPVPNLVAVVLVLLVFLASTKAGASKAVR
jgi:hypothetical protein